MNILAYFVIPRQSDHATALPVDVKPGSRGSLWTSGGGECNFRR